MYRILLVDDEQNVLNALRRELDEIYEIEAFNNPLDALQRSQDVLFDLVISDYKMPEMNGIEFLKQFARLQPDTARIILSGQADADVLVNAINETHVYRFINKPWDKFELAAEVSKALEYRRVMLEYRKYSKPDSTGKFRALQANMAEKRYCVLVVDDEPNILSAIVRDLTTRSPFLDWQMIMQQMANPEFQPANGDLRFDVITATSPREVLENAAKMQCDVVIADYFMKDMDGIRFLDEYRKLQPNAARIMLSGHADKNALIDAINRSEIFAFISKPWREYDLMSALTQAITYKNVLLEVERLRKSVR